MTGYQVVYALSNLALISAFLGLIVFIVRYWMKSRWREFSAGRSLMYFVLALASMVTSGLLVMIFGPEYVGREWVRFSLFTFISIMTWRLTIALIRVQRKGTRTPEQIQEALDKLLLHPTHPERRAHPRYTPTEEIPVVSSDGDVKEGT